ncbi:MAG: hypothetical protein PHF00_05435 [Elusimicrobia bacterium]|nr:hypothetical protein [Elusimicrobiota bacterium]
MISMLLSAFMLLAPVRAQDADQNQTPPTPPPPAIEDSTPPAGPHGRDRIREPRQRRGQDLKAQEEARKRREERRRKRDELRKERIEHMRRLKEAEQKGEKPQPPAR